MGCNTSKESVQPAAEEAKEDAKNGDIHKSNDDSVTEKASTKSPTATKSQEGKLQESSQSERKEEEAEQASDKEKEEAAATRIQAAFRGHHARKSMKDTESSVKQAESKTDSELTKEQLSNEFRADDKELCDAATKIQASFRGHMSRKEQAATAMAKSVVDTADKIEEKVRDAVDELEGIDLTDPDLNKAATKIQASFRGHKVRQEVGVSSNNDGGKK